MVDAMLKHMRELVRNARQLTGSTSDKVADTGEPIRLKSRPASAGPWYDVYAFRVGNPALQKWV
jgi:hypothetical protein